MLFRSNSSTSLNVVQPWIMLRKVLRLLRNFLTKKLPRLRKKSLLRLGFLIVKTTTHVTCQVVKSNVWPWLVPLAMKPDVLLLDEPTSALDPELVGEVEKSIADAAKSGQTMILVSHDMNFVYQVADKVLFLEKGHILEQGTPDEIFNHPKEERTKEFFASYSKQYL